MSSSSLFHLLSVYSHVSPIRDILQTFAAAAAALRFRLMEASHISTSVQTADVGGARTSHPDIGVKGKMFILAFTSRTRRGRDSHLFTLQVSAGNDFHRNICWCLVNSLRIEFIDMDNALSYIRTGVIRCNME